MLTDRFSVSEKQQYCQSQVNSQVNVDWIRTLPRGGMYWKIHPPRPKRFPKGGDFVTGISQHIDHIVNQKLTLRKVLMLILTGISQHIDHIVNQKSTFRNDSKTVCDSLHWENDARWVLTVKICFHMICLCAYAQICTFLCAYAQIFTFLCAYAWDFLKF